MTRGPAIDFGLLAEEWSCRLECSGSVDGNGTDGKMRDRQSFTFKGGIQSQRATDDRVKCDDGGQIVSLLA